MLMSSQGAEVARRNFRIPCGGSMLWRLNEDLHRSRTHPSGRATPMWVVRDTTCRLFGYHGLIGSHAFSLDHMFGFLR